MMPKPASDARSVDMTVMLGLDPGERRTGIALGDPAGILASPLCTHDRQRDGSLIELVVRLCEEHDVRCVVVGHALTQDAQSGVSAGRSHVLARKLGSRLKARGVEVILVDERYSTAEALRMLTGHPHAREERDALAAALILQAHLDSVRDRGESGA